MRRPLLALAAIVAGFALLGCPASTREVYAGRPLIQIPLAEMKVVSSTYQLGAQAVNDPLKLASALGIRATRLLRAAIVVQVRLVSLNPEVRLPSGAFVLRLGERAVAPLSPSEVLDLVSLPAQLDPVLPSAPPPDKPDAADPIAGWLAATHSEHYREGAASDVLSKTTVPREPIPGEPLDLILVFFPESPGATAPRSAELVVSLDVGAKQRQHVIPIPFG